MELTIRTRCNGEKFKITCTYTDNIIDGLSDKEEVEKVKQKLREHYDVKTMEKVNNMFEIEMEKMEERI